MHYILKDHLGSWTTTTDAEGNVEQELSFDAWGNRRDPNTWRRNWYNPALEEPMFDRGYTGHEHLYAFGLINMNGRCYDPVMSSFLSVDAFVQSPDNSQNFNRYSYCLNNPLKYTDPSGWVMLGGMTPNNPFHDNWGQNFGEKVYTSAEVRQMLWTMDISIGIWMVGNEMHGSRGGDNPTSPKIEFAGKEEEEAYYKYRNEVFSHDTEEYKSIQEELLLLERASEVFRIRIGDNITNKAGGGNFIYNMETEEFDVNLADFGIYNIMEKISHELKHAFQYIDGKLGFDLRQGLVNYIAYDFLDEEEAFKRQGLFGNTLKFEEIQTCYPELWTKGYFFKNQTIQNCAYDNPALPFNLIKAANRISYEHNKKPVYLYHGWKKDIY